jgi:hypothetical protein
MHILSYLCSHRLILFIHIGPLLAYRCLQTSQTIRDESFRLGKSHSSNSGVGLKLSLTCEHVSSRFQAIYLVFASTHESLVESIRRGGKLRITSRLPDGCGADDAAAE